MTLLSRSWLLPFFIAVCITSLRAQQDRVLRPRPFVNLEGETRARALDPRITESIAKTIVIAQGPVQLEVKFQKGHEAWAAYTMKMAERFIPAAEKYLGTPLAPPAGGIKIIELMGPTAYCGGYQDIQTNADDWALGSPGLLFHEIGHLWFGYITHYGEWHSQGLVSFLPIAMVDAGYLTLTPEEYASIFRHWGFTANRPANDVPLFDYGKRQTDKDNFMLYIKSFRIQYLLYRELGQEKFRVLLSELLRERKTGTDEFMRILGARKPDTDWNSLLSGWLLAGPYRRFNWESFQDADHDGISDLDEIYLGLDPANDDTDGDGYADGWERAHGFDPKSRNSPANYDGIAIDGLVDLHSPPPVAAQTDPRGEATASTDIASGQVYVIGKRVYVRYSFYSLESRPIQLTLHIRRADGRNFWWQMHSDGLGPWLLEFDDGEAFEQWKPSKIPASVIESKLGRVFEAAFDPSVMGLAGEFQIEFKAGGYAGSKEIWDSDSTDSLNVSLDPSSMRMNGSAAELESHAIGRISDPPNDTGMDHDIYDIKEVVASMDERNLYLGIRFHQPITGNEWRTLTAHIRINDGKRNYWVQCWGTGCSCAVMYFNDGQKFEDWTTVSRHSGDALSSLMVARGDDVELRIPLAAFQTPDPQKIQILSVRTIMGGTKKGKAEWSADETDWLKLSMVRER